jgi:fatty-acyl-CoA synthase
VIGMPDERWGEVGCAVVVRREGAVLEPQQILDHCAGQLARFKQPRRILFTDALPRNATGKVLKHELRRMLAEGELA